MNQWIIKIICVFGIISLYSSVSSLYKISFFPPIDEIALRLYQISSSGQLFLESGNTLVKIIPSITVSLPLAIIWSLLLVSANPFSKQLTKILLILGMTIPIIFWVTVSIISIGIGRVASIFTIILTITPLMTITITEGITNLNPDLNEMTNIFQFSKWSRFKHLVIPQLSPFLIAAMRSGLTNAWKAALVTEIFGISSGIGYQIMLSFYQFSSGLIYAWTIGFALVILLLDLSVIKLSSFIINKIVKFS